MIKFNNDESIIQVGIIGGAGYTGGELIRILLQHPHASIVFVHSQSNAGKYLYDVHEGIWNDTDLKFTCTVDFSKIDVLFLCSAHGDSAIFLQKNQVPQNVKIIDLSTDFRHKREGNNFIYGLPELNKSKIEKADKVANPGCFATAIQLALLPFAYRRLINHDIHIHAITGSTGAGVKPGTTTHFSWRADNISIYKPFEHQHLQEIGESMVQLLPTFGIELNFIPVRGNFTRGIFATLYTKTDIELEEAVQVYNDYYEDAPFTHIINKPLDLKQVINTNKCLIHLEKHGNKLLITSCIDNLLKGASGQAVQNMNLIFGLPETCGLTLKGSAF